MKLCDLEQVISKCRPKMLIEVFSKIVDKVKGFFKKHEYQLVRIANFPISSVESCSYFVRVPESAIGRPSREGRPKLKFKPSSITVGGNSVLAKILPLDAN